MDYGLIVVLGLVIGSFLNVCIYRIPKEESIAFPPSHCANCKHKLMPIDLIPVFSYIFLRGKCRYCKEKISAKISTYRNFKCIIVFNYILKIWINSNCFKILYFSINFNCYWNDRL